MRGRAFLADPLGAGVVGGALIGAVEAASVPDLGARGVAWVLCVAIGALAGAISWITGALGRRVGGAWRGAFLDALPLALPLALVGGSLFDGALAAKLPGAAWGHVWLPIVGVAGLTVTLALARPRLTTHRRRWAVAALIAVGVLALEAADRRLFRSEYPDIHALLAIVAIVAAGVGVRVLAHGAPSLTLRARAITGAAALAMFAATLAFGLGATSSRWALATHGSHGRHLARVVRAAFDLDRDGTASVLGGGDCAEFDASRHPGARDVAGNGVDEDCDGVDAQPPPPPPDAADRAADRAAWTAGPGAALRRAAADWNLLLVTVDTLRADLLAPDAPGRAEFPHLTRLLTEGVWFSRGIAPSAGTDVSLSVLVTGRANPFVRIRQTLFEAARAAGRRTHAVLPREVLRHAGEVLLTRGLSSHDVVVGDGAKADVGDRLTGATTTAKALAFVDDAGVAPWVLWAHYFDVHEHHQVPLSAADLAAVDATGLSRKAHRYRAMVAATDRALGALLDGLAARGQRERTLIVLLSDHGESLGEDPRLPDNHNVFAYHALTHVPIAVIVPGGRRAMDDEPVTLADLPATLTSLFGWTPLDEPAGVDLGPHLTDAPDRLRRHPRALSIQETDQRAVIEWPWKLLVRPAEDLVELYDLSEDPSERDDRARAEPARVRALRARFADFPEIPLDRTRAGRAWRERMAAPP